MNYFEHHIGDWDQATAHLTAVEDGIYSRLVRWYMASEGPLPLDVAVIQRRVRARAKDEKAAVHAVLEEFFEKREDGYHQHRCDEEISRFHETAPEREAKKENDRERQRRARERRKSLFDTLRVHGLVPRFDATTSELEAMLSRASIDVGHNGVTDNVTRDNTATHTPDTKHQTPKNPSGSGASSKSTRKPAGSKRVPADFAVDADMEAWAIESAPLIDWRRETEKFRDWEFKTPRTDWAATWRTWMRKAQEGAAERGQSAASSIFAGAI